MNQILVALAAFALSSAAEAAPSALVTQTVVQLENTLGVNCVVSSASGNDSTFSCTGEERSFEIVATDEGRPAFNGTLIVAKVKHSASLEEQRQLISRITEQALVTYFQRLDGGASWSGRVAQDTFWFRNPKALITIVDDSDQTSAAFVELSVEEELSIFIGHVG